MEGQSITYMEIDGQPVDLDEDDGDSLTHLFCECMGNDIALCGSDISDADDGEFYYAGSDACVVCLDLDKTHDDRCFLKGVS